METNKGFVYFICNTIDERIYVGSTISMKKRRRSHISHLKRGNHSNKYLQNFVNKYGIDSIYFEVVYKGVTWIEEEQKYIDDTSLTLFNLSLKAEYPASKIKYICSEETKLKISQRRIQGAEVRNKLKRKDILQIKELLRTGQYTQQQLSKMFNVGETTICGINTGKAYSYITIPGGKTREAKKLTEKDVLQIKQYLIEDKTCVEIAKLYPVGKTAIQKIKDGVAWKHLTGFTKDTFKDRALDVTKFSKLTLDQVKEIKQLLKEGWTQKNIAEKFGVIRQTIQNINVNRCWKDIN